ncbi:MAG: NCS2 family permease [Fibrobacter sp.]|nr:NCS2 family permease [Fibrobacter sp.]
MSEKKKKVKRWAGRELKRESLILEKFFRLTENKADITTELLAGVATFITVAYILAVNPDILAASGMPKGGVFIATALAAAVGSALMGFFANYPFVLAPGLGINAFFSYTVVLMMGYSWQFALLTVFVEGIIFLVLSVTSIREKLFNSIPFSLKAAVAVGIGLFIAFIALQGGKIIVSNEATLVGLVDFRSADFHTTGIWTILTFAGILITATVIAKGIHAGLLIGIFATWFLGIFAEIFGIYVPNPEQGFYSIIPHFKNYFGTLSNTFNEFGVTCGALFNPDSWTHSENGVVVSQGFSLLKSIDFFIVLFAFFFVDFFDTLGTLIGVSLKGGFMGKDGTLPRASRALSADAIATSVGAVLGTSTTTTFVESAAGVAVGARTGLTAITAAGLFVSAIFFAPIFLAIPSFATAPALFVVGFIMVTAVSKINFNDASEAIPAFICMISMPLTYSIADGIMFGVISYTLINIVIGKIRKVHWLLIALTVFFMLKYIML